MGLEYGEAPSHIPPSFIRCI